MRIGKQVKAKKAAYNRERYQIPEVKARRKSYVQRYQQTPKFKVRSAIYRKKYLNRPGVKERSRAQESLRAKEKEYQDLLCLYEERKGKIPRYLILRLEALSEYFGRDLEEWRTDTDKEWHGEQLNESSQT